MQTSPSETLTLFSFRRCPFAIRVRMVLAEKKLSYQIREENLSHLSPELLALHPEGRVPLLVHETSTHGNTPTRLVIYQSTIITEYLDEQFPDTPLMPRSPADRTRVRLWTYWCDTLFKPDLDLFKYEYPGLSPLEQDALRERLHAYLFQWNQALEKGPFLVGDQITLADIHLFPFARQFLSIRIPLAGVEKYTALSAWLCSMIERPTFAQVMEKGRPNNRS